MKCTLESVLNLVVFTAVNNVLEGYGGMFVILILRFILRSYLGHQQVSDFGEYELLNFPTLGEDMLWLHMLVIGQT